MPSRTTGRATATLTSNRIGCLSIEWIRKLSALSAPAAGCNGMPSPLQSYAATGRRQRCKVIYAPISDEVRQSAKGLNLSFPNPDSRAVQGSARNSVGEGLNPVPGTQTGVMVSKVVETPLVTNAPNNEDCRVVLPRLSDDHACRLHDGRNPSTDSRAPSFGAAHGPAFVAPSPEQLGGCSAIDGSLGKVGPLRRRMHVSRLSVRHNAARSDCTNQ